MTNHKVHKKPNLFILGAAKSGTTTLYNYLKSHPSIYLSAIKEPTFFCEDFQVVKNPIKYFELFDPVTNEAYVGEASHGYLSDPKVAKLLRTLFPNSKFILTLRNPAERAYSLYNHMKRYRFERLNTFEKALAIEADRMYSKKFRNNNPQYFHNFLYFESGKYGSQIQRYLSLFDKNQFLFLKYDDLIKKPDETLSKIYNFLDIPAVSLTSQIHSNKGYNVKSILLEKLIRSKLISNKISIKLKIKKTLIHLNNTSLQPMNPETKISLMMKYKEDLDLLYELTEIRF